MNVVEQDFALEATGLGRRYRRGWAVRDCSFALPVGRVTALVGLNGAGKSTLLRMAAGLLTPSAGQVTVLGRPAQWRGTGGVSFLAQEKPLYRGFTVAETMRFGRAMNPGWDGELAARLVEEARLPADAKVGSLSGGHRTRLALVLALARRPELLLVDEPLAEMDPVARQEIMQALMGVVAETGMGLVISSHAIADLEDVCDHLLVLGKGRMELTGPVEDLLATHRVVIAPQPADFGQHEVISTRGGERQVSALIKVDGELSAPDWAVENPTLDELVLAYLRRANSEAAAA